MIDAQPSDPRCAVVGGLNQPQPAHSFTTAVRPVEHRRRVHHGSRTFTVTESGARPLTVRLPKTCSFVVWAWGDPDMKPDIP